MSHFRHFPQLRMTVAAGPACCCMWRTAVFHQCRALSRSRHGAAQATCSLTNAVRAALETTYDGSSTNVVRHIRELWLVTAAAVLQR